MMLHDPRKEYAKLFGARLDDLRASAGLSKAALARAAGISDTSLNGYLSGRNEPTVYVVYRLARALDCSADILVRPDEDFDEPSYAKFSGDELEVKISAANGVFPQVIIIPEANKAIALKGDFTTMERRN